MSRKVSELLIENMDEDGSLTLSPKEAGLLLTWVERHERLWREAVTIHEALNVMTDRLLTQAEGDT